MNYDFITINDDIYPECLKEISDPPEKLYYKGKTGETPVRPRHCKSNLIMTSQIP